MVAQPGRLVGEERESGRMRLGEAERGEAVDLREHELGGRPVDAVARSAFVEALAIGLDGVVEHLLLEDDRTEGVLEALGEERVVVRDYIVRILPFALPTLHVRMYRL